MDPVYDAVSPHEKVAEEVRVALARRRLSGQKAAEALGWSAFYLSRRLSAKVAFDVNDLSALADLLEVSVMAFLAPLEESPRGVTHATLRSLAGGTTKPKYSTPLCPEMTEMSFSSPSGPVRTQAA
jgi:hypothetical protein